MRSWFVGSITLGTALLAYGICMLAAKVTGALDLADVAAWWPVLLILLGFEVLAAVFIPREKPVRIKFCRGSVFLIGVMITFSMVVSAFIYAADLVVGDSRGYGEAEKVWILLNTRIRGVSVNGRGEGIEISVERVK